MIGHTYFALYLALCGTVLGLHKTSSASVTGVVASPILTDSMAASSARVESLISKGISATQKENQAALLHPGCDDSDPEPEPDPCPGPEPEPCCPITITKTEEIPVTITTTEWDVSWVPTTEMKLVKKTYWNHDTVTETCYKTKVYSKTIVKWFTTSVVSWRTTLTRTKLVTMTETDTDTKWRTKTCWETETETDVSTKTKTVTKTVTDTETKTATTTDPGVTTTRTILFRHGARYCSWVSRVGFICQTTTLGA